MSGDLGLEAECHMQAENLPALSWPCLPPCGVQVGQVLLGASFDLGFHSPLPFDLSSMVGSIVQSV